MRTVFALTLLAMCGLPLASSACDWDTGARDQKVYLAWNGKSVVNWTAAPGAMQKVALPNGYTLGVKLEDPEAEQLREMAAKLRHVPEMVKISLFDLSGAEPKLLTYTYGGTNSLQGYGAKGGADRVEALGSPGVLLTLMKPVCMAPSAVAVSQAPQS